MKNKNLISISGKKSSGKDTIGKIINFLLLRKLYKEGNFEYPNYLTTFNPNYHYKCLQGYKIIKFADKLKDIVCILLDCTREQLEDETFKNTPLGEEWWYYKGKHGSLIPHTEDINRHSEDLVKLTPRLIMQLIGTDCFRKIIHPDIWVISTMKNYKDKSFGSGFIDNLKECKSWACYPKWILTDTRFPNEIEAIDKYNGIKIKVIRYQVGDKVTKPSKWGRTICEVAKIQSSDVILTKNGNTEEEVFVWELKPHIEGEHISKTALDDYEDWDYIVYNTGSIDDLIKEVGNILEIEKII